MMAYWLQHSLAGQSTAIQISAPLFGVMLGGALYAELAWVLKTSFRVDEVISTVMLNNIIVFGPSMLLQKGPWSEAGSFLEQTAKVDPGNVLPTLLPGSRLHLDFLLVLAAAALVHVVITRTHLGFEIRAAGQISRALQVQGMSATHRPDRHGAVGPSGRACRRGRGLWRAGTAEGRGAGRIRLYRHHRRHPWPAAPPRPCSTRSRPSSCFSTLPAGPRPACACGEPCMLEQLLQSTVLVSVLAATIRIATPVLLAALGELVAERAGVYNMGVEGTMLLGAVMAYLVAAESGSLWLGLVASGLFGGLTSLCFGFLVITLRIEQIVTGLAINLPGSGLTVFWMRTAYSDADKTPAILQFEVLPLPLLADIPVLGPVLFQQKLLTYLALLAVPAIPFFLYRTRQGLDLRCCGENPKALGIKGLSVAARQFAAVVFGGLMAGVGGAFLTLAGSARLVPEITAGRGRLAIVIVLAGMRRPVPVLVATLVFSFLDALQLQIPGIGVSIPYQLLLAMPYCVAILVLAVRRRHSGAPDRLGIPYVRG